MRLRAASNHPERPSPLLPILIVVALCLPTAIAATSATPALSANPLASITSSHATLSKGDAMLAAARASLAEHHGPSAPSPPPPPPLPTNWTLVNTTNASTLPLPRQMQAMAYDPVDDYVVMFGGGNVNPVGQLNDTWVFSNGTWTQLFPTPAPSVRRSASFAWDAADGYLLLFGGIDPGTVLGTSSQYQDTWSFLNGSWTDRTAPTVNATNTPSVRWNAPMVYDPARGAMILFGGCNSLACASSMNDTWEYYGGAWTEITSSVGTAPSVRGTEPLVWYPPDQADLLFGGSTPNQTVLGDTWELQATGWTQLHPATSPPATGDSWMIYDNATFEAVLFGGFRYTVSPSGYAVADTWGFANGTWTNQTASNAIAPSARWGMQAAAAFDPSRGCGYLFGGSASNDSNLGDTWTYGCASGTNVSRGGGSGGGGSGGSGSGGGNMSPLLSLSVSPASGAAPLYFNATAQLLNANASSNYTLQLIADGPGTSSTAWNASVSPWSGASTTLSGELTLAGSYYMIGQVGEVVAGVWMLIAVANLTLDATGATGTAPSVSLTVTPASGTAPLNVTLALTPSGGTGSYNLSVCAVGPSSLPNATGPCTAIASQFGVATGTWTVNDSLSVAGNYTIVGTVLDTAGLSANASAAVTVTPSVPAPPLAASASGVAPAVTTVEGATYAFTTSITGGVAPYTVQWVFGDGTSGSAVPGSTIQHTYRASGTFTATLTVTDAVGDRASASVGPFVVSLPLASGSAGASWSTVATLGVAAVVGVLAASAIGVTAVQLLRRREALNWLREVEEARRPDEPGPK